MTKRARPTVGIREGVCGRFKTEHKMQPRCERDFYGFHNVVVLYFYKIGSDNSKIILIFLERF